MTNFDLTAGIYEPSAVGLAEEKPRDNKPLDNKTSKRACKLTPFDE